MPKADYFLKFSPFDNNQMGSSKEYASLNISVYPYFLS